MADDTGNIEVRDIVAAMLDNKHDLSHDQMDALGKLLDHPDLEADQLREFIQTLYNIVAGIIDYKWQTHAMLPAVTTCGQKSEPKDESRSSASNMLYSADKKLSPTYKKASARVSSNEDVKEGSA